MGRPIRIEYPGALYHITSRGNERRKIFLDGADRIKFLSLLRDYHNRYGILIHAYVQMDNHYHFILETPQGGLLKIMHGVNGGYTNYFNRKHGRVGHLFQGRYRAILVEKDRYLLSLSRYVHLNPVRAGLVRKPEEYPWSSYRGYIWKEQEEDWMEYGWVLSQFGEHRKRAEWKYKTYVEEGLRREAENPFKDVYAQVALGREEFIERIKGGFKGKDISPGIVERKRLIEYLPIERILRQVEKVFGTREEELLEKGSRSNTSRKVALYLSQRYTGLSNREIGERFGGMEASGVSKAASRVREEIVSDKKLSKLVGDLDSSFKA
ncbi:MAG: transposase [Thermodesulfobacteriota bacterium]|nr:transposase [Thermodesulfobacteriota bacterium]